MANITFGKVWSLDTIVGMVTQNPTCIHSIIVRFTTAAAGSLVLTTARPDVSGTNNVQEVLLDLKTTAASTAAAYILDKQYLMGNQTFAGLTKLVSANVDTIYVITGNPV